MRYLISWSYRYHSEYYQSGNQIEDFYNVLVEPIKKKDFSKANPTELKFSIGNIFNEKESDKKFTIDFNFAKDNNVKTKLDDIDYISQISISDVEKNSTKRITSLKKDEEDEYNEEDVIIESEQEESEQGDEDGEESKIINDEASEITHSKQSNTSFL